ncbi:hypothetical protein [Cronobacter sakazakii]|uniref:hypothetical protein n=1 Tax=Cronobacter sakazakii TaxID=28141 RepID=UPI0020A6C6F7|nr:hypothetical protein [Cronobacter sakazakii]
MELTEKYAVWYSTCTSYGLVQNYFSKENGSSKFEKDFGLKIDLLIMIMPFQYGMGKSMESWEV